MKEDFLHFVWRYGLFDQSNLCTIDGQALQIIRKGNPNAHAGPDFFDAQISIAGLLWAGNVEIHLQSSDWLKHRHQFDAAYQSVVLHVVWNHDEKILRNTAEEIPTLELKHLVAADLLEHYQQLAYSLALLPCANRWQQLPALYIENWLERLSLSRLEKKAQYVQSLLSEPKKHTAQAFFEVLSKAFGFHLNAMPMELLARSIPYTLLQKLRGQELSIAALLFGQAGFLQKNFKDPYPKQLKQEYAFLQQKHHLQPMDVSMWKFLRLRPLNFPTIRLAQFAVFLTHIPEMMDCLTEERTQQQWQTLFETTPPVYWLNHFTFDKSSSVCSKKIGKTAIDSILMNGLVVFLFAYGQQPNKEAMMENAWQLLLSIPPEDNVYTRSFASTLFKPKNAMHSQALRELNECYCVEKKCVDCHIGSHILLD